jgi:hypothetical protein
MATLSDGAAGGSVVFYDQIIGSLRDGGCRLFRLFFLLWNGRSNVFLLTLAILLVWPLEGNRSSSTTELAFLVRSIVRVRAVRRC